jgi:hypothetical protein
VSEPGEILKDRARLGIERRHIQRRYHTTDTAAV